MIKTSHLCKVYRGRHDNDVRAVDDVSLEIDAGSLVVLRGPSGSGKTTLLSLLGCLSRPSSGSIVFDGRDVSNCSDVELARVRRDIGFVFQHFSLLPKLPVWENVTYPMIPRGIRSTARFEIARDVLQRMGLEHKIYNRPDQLSGGEQQRVAVARAIAAEPRLILADEPTSNLDLSAATELTHLFQEIHATGVTLVFSTHRAELLDLATDVFELEDGELKTG